MSTDGQLHKWWAKPTLLRIEAESSELILPRFRYHPDPTATGAVRPSDETCVCCGLARKFVYAGPVYGGEDLDGRLCPWCIADGRAAAELGASFADTWALTEAGIPNEVIDEIHRRTPGYTSWQAEEWLSHCGDACAFHGDILLTELETLFHSGAAALTRSLGMSSEERQILVRDYRPGGDPAVYKFVCLHCGSTLLGADRN